MSLTPEQQTAVYANSSVAVTAGAGTGKTHLLTERFLTYLEKHNFSPLEIVAVTFTEKAAQELRSRIRGLIQQRLPDRLDILAEIISPHPNPIVNEIRLRLVKPLFDFGDDRNQPASVDYDHLVRATVQMKVTAVEQIQSLFLGNLSFGKITQQDGR